MRVAERATRCLALFAGGLAACGVPGPAHEDLVFCATAVTSGSAPSAAAAADAIARLAPTGPLDFVLLPGDNFAPDGVDSIDDPQWRERFELLFDHELLAVPFFPAFGPADHRGDLASQIQYGVMNLRWTLADHTYHFVEYSHGEQFSFVSIDTPSLLGPLGIPRNRHAGRFVSETLRPIERGWKIAFGHHPLFAGAPPEADERGAGAWLAALGVDVYIAGGGAGAGITESSSGVVQVSLTPAGFAWCRFDGAALSLSVRAADGAEVASRRLTR